jgi:hypothetical protein
MNNKPVAWINLDRFKDEALYLADCVSENKVENMGITTPLYTHPVKEYAPNQTLECSFDLAGFKPPAKTLTDEEINKTYLEKYDGHMGFLSPDEVREFARAILRKAQEK